MSKLAQKRIHTLLFCQVCYERFQIRDKAPKVLPCQHTFCNICIDCLIQSGPFKCPLCRTPQSVPETGVDGYPTNLTVLALLDCYCTLCQNDEDLKQCSHCDKPICGNCTKQHAEQMTETALKLLQQLTEDQTTMHCLSKDVKRYMDNLQCFVTDQLGSSLSSASTNQEIVRGVKRSLLSDIDDTTPLIHSAETLLEAINNVVRNGQEVLNDMGTLERQDLVQTCNEECDGTCLTKKYTLRNTDSTDDQSEDSVSRGCSPTVVIKHLNKHLKQVRSHIDQLSEKVTMLSRYNTSRIHAQIQYLSSIHEGRGTPTARTGCRLGDSPSKPKTATHLSRPNYVSFSPKSGSFHVLDASRSQIVILSASGKEVSTIPVPDKDPESGKELRYAGLTVSAEGNVLLTEQTTDTVLVVNHTGEVLDQFGKRGRDNGQFKSPMDISLDKNDHLHVCDWGNERIQVLDTEGNFIREYGQDIANTDIFRPQFIHVAKETGYVYVSDTQNGRLHIFSESGSLVRTVESRSTDDVEGIPDLTWPAGIVDIEYGCVLLTDWGTHTVHVLTSCGQYLCKFDGPGNLWRDFNGLKGLAFGDKGHLAICDTLNDRVLFTRL